MSGRAAGNLLRQLLFLKPARLGLAYCSHKLATALSADNAGWRRAIAEPSYGQEYRDEKSIA